MFDQKVDVARSRFSINGLTLLTRLGGLIGVGRTLLWILVSLLGAVQVTLSDLRFVVYQNTALFSTFLLRPSVRPPSQA